MTHERLQELLDRAERGMCSPADVREMADTLRLWRMLHYGPRSERPPVSSQWDAAETD
jgi:hypothetical protein